MTRDVKVQFGNRLRMLRQQKGLSQEKLGFLIRIDGEPMHRAYISAVERGLVNICLENIQLIAAALKVSMADLMPDQTHR